MNEMSVQEALEKADKNGAAAEGMPSVSRTLAAEVRRLKACEAVNANKLKQAADALLLVDQMIIDGAPMRIGGYTRGLVYHALVELLGPNYRIERQPPPTGDEQSIAESVVYDESYNWCPQCSHPRGACVCADQAEGSKS